MAEITDTALQGTSKSPNTITLQEFNNRIKRLLADPSVMNCWVVAETSRWKTTLCLFWMICPDASLSKYGEVHEQMPL